jgi:2-C-methyl-D-erythritol 2,4-cyclodiphosphate synthase
VFESFSLFIRNIPESEFLQKCNVYILHRSFFSLEFFFIFWHYFFIKEDTYMAEEGFLCKVGLGQDSHAFVQEGDSKPCVLGGIIIENALGFEADSDGDVILHAICNAISSLSHTPILGRVAIELCQKKGIKDSKVYLQEALKTLQNMTILHLAISIEAKRPRLQEKIDSIRENIAIIMGLSINQVGITVTSGDHLTPFGQGKGLQCFCLLSVKENFS